MRTGNLYILPAFVWTAAALMFSCTPEISSDDASSSYRTVQVNADIATRTMLSSDSSVLEWVSGDAVALFNDADKTVEKLVYSGTSVMTATKVPVSASELYSMYPCQELQNEGPSSVRVTIPTFQIQNKAGEMDGRILPMCAAGSINDNAVDLTFRPVASAMAVNVYKSTLSQEEKLIALRVVPQENEGFAGDAVLDITQSETEMTCGSSSEPVVLSLTNPYGLSSSRPSDPKRFGGQLYVVLARQVYSSVRFDIQTTEGLYTITMSSGEIDLALNDIVAFNIDLSQAEFSQDGRIFDADSDHLRFDLSFCTEDHSELLQPFDTSISDSASGAGTVVHYTKTVDGVSYPFSIYSTDGHFNNISSSLKGLCLNGGTSGPSYMVLPVVPDMALKYISLRSGTPVTTAKDYVIIDEIGAEPLITLSPTGFNWGKPYVMTGLPSAQKNKSYILYTESANPVLSEISLTYVRDSDSDEAPIVSVNARTSPAHSWDTYPAYTLGYHIGQTQTDQPERDIYGGWKAEPRFEQDGWFRCKKNGGRWWMVTPDGNPYIGIGLASFRVEDDQYFNSKYGGSASSASAVTAWASEQVPILKDYGFNCTGAWSNTSNARRVQATDKIPYVVIFSPMSSYVKSVYNGEYPDGVVPVFDEAFPATVTEVISESSSPSIDAVKDDPYLIGYITDNELLWNQNTLDVFLGWAEDNPNRQAAEVWMEENGITTITNDVRQRFVAHCMERYFELVLAQLRLHDARHMYLGCKFDSWNNALINQYAFEIAGKYMDAISVDFYYRWAFDMVLLKKWEQWSGRPCLLTEWYVTGADSGLANEGCAGWEVQTQKDRGLFYMSTVCDLVRSGVCVGWHWFRYKDIESENVNRGVFKADFTPYEDCLEMMKKTNSNVYNLACGDVEKEVPSVSGRWYETLLDFAVGSGFELE